MVGEPITLHFLWSLLLATCNLPHHLQHGCSKSCSFMGLLALAHNKVQSQTRLWFISPVPARSRSPRSNSGRLLLASELRWGQQKSHAIVGSGASIIIKRAVLFWRLEHLFNHLLIGLNVTTYGHNKNNYAAFSTSPQPTNPPAEEEDKNAAESDDVRQ